MVDRLINCINSLEMQVDPIHNPDEKQVVVACNLRGHNVKKCATCQAHRGEGYIGKCLVEERDGEIANGMG